ncbi:MAG: 50S ribosomal protein L19 [Planctomycetota bacterium]
MSDELLRKAGESSIRKDVPQFNIGDTVDVSCRIVEGDKERIQVFTGTVIARKGSGVSETFTVRRMVGSEGVERIFPLHSPQIAGVDVVRKGKARRAKLYYLRKRIGRATRLKKAAGIGGEGEAESPPEGQEPAEALGEAQQAQQEQGTTEEKE